MTIRKHKSVTSWHLSDRYIAFIHHEGRQDKKHKNTHMQI